MKKLLLLVFLPLMSLAQTKEGVKVTVKPYSTFQVLSASGDEFEDIRMAGGDTVIILKPGHGEGRLLAMYKNRPGIIWDTYINTTPEYYNYISPLRAQKVIQDSLDIEKKVADYIAELNSKKIYGIAISDYTVTGESYSGGIEIEFYNPTAKTIKYIWITTRPINPVGDLAATPKTVQAIGPIKPKETGSYEFEDIYFSKVIDKISVTKLKIQYMDGTIKELIGTTLAKVWALP